MIPLIPRELPRQSTPVTTGESHLWNLETELGEYHRAGNEGEGIRYWYSNFTAPPFARDVFVTTNGSDKQARMIQDHRLRLLLSFEREENTLETFSDDDGQTWSEPAVSFSGGLYPTIAVDRSTGMIVRACYRDGSLYGTTQYPGEALPSDEFAFLGSDGAPLQVTKGSFHLSAALDGQGRWLLVVKQDGEIVDFESFDDARSWRLAGETTVIAV